MGEQTFNISDDSLEQHIVTLFEKLECLKRDASSHDSGLAGRMPARLEVRTLSLWKAVVAECAASFLYVFIVCGAAGGAGVGASASAVLLSTALASGCAIATLTLCFAHISGAHVNPAVSAALCVRRRVSPLRAALYVAAQCGGAIAGAAAIYGSARETYGDDAVGFVQVQRLGNVCTVKAKITPEHRIKSKAYCCTFTCDEKEETVLNVECHDCAAQKGGCKHSVAFLTWLHRRSEEPSPTEKKCYWAKPKLATIGTTTKFIKAKDMVPSSVISSSAIEDNNTDNTNRDQFFQAVVQSIKENSIRNQLSVYFTKNEFKKLSLHNLIHQYKKEGNNINSADDFIDYCSNKITMEECHKAEEATVCQASSPLWHELRYCRITASKVHEATHCKTPDGALIEQIFGASVPETLAMKRGKRLESAVRAEVAKTRAIVIENGGFFLKPDWPHLGASPDGLTSEYVVEIKCPSTKKGKECFVKNNVLGSKSKAQIQLQMFFCNKVKGLFCVANENFESNNKVEIFEEDYDKNYCTELLEKSTNFWKSSVFPKLVET